jgi:hypothetical protein
MVELRVTGARGTAANVGRRSTIPTTVAQPTAMTAMTAITAPAAILRQCECML